MQEPNIWLWVWVILAVVLSIAEIFTAGFFMLPFGIGAACAAALEFFWPGSIGAQWIAFVGVSSLLLVGLRRFASHVTHEPPMKVAGDRLIGKRGVVLEEIGVHDVGRVRVEREEWRADAEGQQIIPADAIVEVMAVVGTHLVVRPVDAVRSSDTV